MTYGPVRIYRFANVEVYGHDFRLLRDGQPLPVEPKAFRVLLYLLEHPQRLVTKEELLDAVWPDTEVSENSLTRAIAQLRRVLGDDTKEPRFIATVPTVGYRFVAEITNATDTIVNESAGAGIQTASQPRKEPTKYRGIALVATGVALLGTLLVTFAWHSRHRASEANESSPIFSESRSRALFSMPGGIWDVALSPDAKEVAFLADGGKSTGDVYVGFVAGDRRDESPLRLTHIKGGSTCCVSWSPDGRELAYAVCGDLGGAVFVVSSLGGRSRKLTDSACLFGQAGSPVWSSDGKSLLLVDNCSPTGPRGVVRLSLATGEKQCLDQPPAGVLGDWKLAVSPDGETVAFIRCFTAGVTDVYTLQLRNGTISRVTSEGKAIWDLMWLPDGQHLVINSSRSGLASMWRVPASGGVMSRETTYPSVGSLSLDGRRLVYVRDVSTPSTIWRADFGAAGGRMLQLTELISSGNSCDAPQPSPDGLQIVFSCEFAGSGGWEAEIWKSNADGSEPRQLTSFGKHAGTPRWSPDSKSIAFDYRPGVHSQIYTMDSNGRNQRMLTSDDSDNVAPSWSHDGKAIYFASNRTGRYEIWKKGLVDSREYRITRHGGMGALESSDRKTLYYSIFDGAGVWSVPVTGGSENRLTEAPHRGSWGSFATTSSGLYVLDVDHEPEPEIFFYDFLHRQLHSVLTLPDLHNSSDGNLSCLSDGRLLLFTRSSGSSSVTTIEYK